MIHAWVFFLAAISTTSTMVSAQTVTIDADNLRPGIDESRRRARDLRLTDEQERQRRGEELARSSGAGVRVSLEIICGALCSTTDRRLTLSGGPGAIDRTALPSEMIIRPSGAANALGGTYRYVATWRSKACSGQFTISETASHYHLRLYDTCGDAGSRESR